MRKSPLQKIVNLTVIAALVVTTIRIAQPAYALSITSFSDNMDRLKASTASNHEIKFVTPSGGGVAAGENISITFSADFTGVSSVLFSDIDFAAGDSNNCTTANFTEKTLAGTPSGATWGAAAAGSVITITSGTDTVAADRCVRIKIGTNASNQTTGVNQITNGAVDDDDTIAIAGTFGDSGTLAVDIITDDQVTITATVDPTITFSISDNAIGFGTLSSSAARWANGAGTGSGTETTAHDLTVATNAASGYTVYVSGATLTSGLNSITAIGGSATASSVGTEQFGIKVGASGGSGGALAPYATANYAYNATGSTQDDIAESTGPSVTTTFSITYLANILATTEAGSYATTLTYTTTGRF